MEQGFAMSAGSSSSALNDGFAQRWEQLKPVILHHYLGQDMQLSKVMDTMRKAPYHFQAFEHSYKYYFSQWGVTKNIPGRVKDAAITALGKRVRNSGKTTPAVSYNGHEISKKRLRRHISAAERKLAETHNSISLSTNVFMIWNLPYRALRSSSMITDHLSPFAVTPAFIQIANRHISQSPRNVPSPNDPPTPTVVAMRNKDLNERAQMFLQAKHEELCKQMENSETKVLTTYLYQFWLFAFKTAKHWGHGPLDWTAELLEFDQFKDNELLAHSSPNTPRGNVGTPASVATPRPEAVAGYVSSLSNHPSLLCKWSIHAAIRNPFEGQESLDHELEEDITAPDGKETWKRWPELRQTFEEKLQAALENNNFSNLDSNDLPLALAQITKTTRRSPKELLQEGFGFSLVARNEEVFWQLLPRAAATNFEGSGIYSFHLLTSFLDGSKTCCNLLDAALNNIAGWSSIEKLYINDHGHTVLDNLMMVILKGHTNCRPVSVDDKFAKLKRFRGEEVDICGRWDADSKCVRELFAEGHAAIPLKWKHMFCHTSVQAICHSIGRLFGPVFAPDIDTPSGLFIKHCQACGMKLQLLPLHSLVLTAAHLARSGCPGENLFGMLACLSRGPDPVQLAERVPESQIAGWTEEVVLGWQVFCTMLRYARDERRPRTKQIPHMKERDDDFQSFVDFSDDELSVDQESDDEDWDDESDVDEELCSHSKYMTGNFYGRSKVVGTLWAAIQTELATYRRLTEGDSWISENFNMRSLLEGLNNGGLVSIGLVEKDMMAPFCQYGRFLDVDDEACPCVDEVCNEHFANLDSDWNRTSYIMIPEGRNESWYDFS